MSKRVFTQEQVEELARNQNVLRCSEKSITYHQDFKMEAVRQYRDEGMSAKQIFRNAGFNIDTIGRKTPKHCLQDWREVFKEKGVNGFAEQRGKNGSGGGRPKTNWSSDKEELRYLEAEVAYLKAENAFLAKLRKKRLN